MHCEGRDARFCLSALTDRATTGHFYRCTRNSSSVRPGTGVQPATLRRRHPGNRRYRQRRSRMRPRNFVLVRHRCPSGGRRLRMPCDGPTDQRDARTCTTTNIRRRLGRSDRCSSGDAVPERNHSTNSGESFGGARSSENRPKSASGRPRTTSATTRCVPATCRATVPTVRTGTVLSLGQGMLSVTDSRARQLPAFFSFHSWTLPKFIAISGLAVTVLGRPDDAITAAITTAVVLVVAALSPNEAWRKPILRFADTVIGVAVGIEIVWIGLRLICPRLKPAS